MNSCPNAQDPTKGDRSIPYVKEWAGIYLADARTRLNEQIDGFEFSIEDVYTLQQVRRCRIRFKSFFDPVLK